MLLHIVVDPDVRTNTSPVASALKHALELNGRSAQLVSWQEDHGIDLSATVRRPGVEATTVEEVVKNVSMVSGKTSDVIDDLFLQFAHGTDIAALSMLKDAASIIIGCAPRVGSEHGAVNLWRAISEAVAGRGGRAVVVIAPYAPPASGAIQHGLIGNLIRDEPGSPRAADVILPAPEPWLDPALDGAGGGSVAHDDPGRLLARARVARRLLELIASRGVR